MKFKINKKMCILFLLVLTMLFLLMIPNVSALGVSPARRIFQFDQGDSSGTIKINNNLHKDIKIAIYATGENSDIINFETNLVTLSSDESYKTISYDVKMPNTLSPGTERIDIVILELPENLQDGVVIIDKGAIVVNKEDSSMLSATNAVISQVFIEVPYPGKYLQAKLYANSVNSGEQLTFTIPLVNKGKQDLSNVKATIFIKGPTNEEITRLNSNDVSLSVGGDGKLVANWIADVNPGMYYVEAIINFDGEPLTLRETFIVGKKNLNIVDLVIDKFKLGQIAKVDVFINSVWNEEIKDVYAIMNLIDSSGIPLAEVKTSSLNVPSFGSETLSAYWDTEGMSIGNYDISVKLFYDDKITEKLFQAVINANNIQITDTSAISGNVIKESGSEKSSTLTLLIIAVIILIIINITWLFYFKKFKKK